MSKQQLRIPASTFLSMLEVAKAKLDNSKNIIIQEDEISYLLLAENYQGDIVVCSHATKPKSVLPGATGGG